MAKINLNEILKTESTKFSVCIKGEKEMLTLHCTEGNLLNVNFKRSHYQQPNFTTQKLEK